MKKFKSLSLKKKILLLLSALVIVAAVVIVICFFAGRGDEEIPEEPVVKELPIVDAPLRYELEGLDDVMALPVGVTDALVVRADIPEEADEEETEPTEEPAEGEKKSHPLTVAATYHYEGIPGVLSRVALYCRLLTEEDFGFVPVNGEMMRTELPVFEEVLSGSVHLVLPLKTNADGDELEEATLFSLQLTWNEEKCSVTVGRIAGRIVTPKQEIQYRPPLTIATAVDYFYSCHPSKLNLPGESMEAYQVLSLDGAVLVGTTPCLRINVYAIDEKTGTNVIAGQYLLADNGMTLFYVDKQGNITELDA